MQYVASLTNGEIKWFLRGTTWTSEIERATIFLSRANAEVAVEKAKKFMPRKKLAKQIVIEPKG